MRCAICLALLGGLLCTGCGDDGGASVNNNNSSSNNNNGNQVSCTPDELRCSGPAGNVEICNVEGDGWSVHEVCLGRCEDNACVPIVSAAGDFHYKVDQFGYLPDDPKVAVISQAVQGQFSPDTFVPGETIEVRTYPDEQVVFSGALEAWNGGAMDTLSGDRGWWFDFSSVTTPGSYTLYDVDLGLYSHVFEIGPEVYRVPLVQAMRTYFYQREAFAKEQPYADARWTDSAAFLADQTARYVLDPDNASLERDVSGGWMDAGDTNKYVTFLSTPIHMLLMSFQERPAAWGDDHNIPESGNGIPDLLDEVDWALSWLMKMQDTDGGVFIKAGDTDLHSASPPSSHTHPRFYGMKCSSSTIAAAAMFAHAAYVFQSINGLESRASELEPLAVAAWDHYHANPRSADCDNGEILSGDADLDMEEQNQTAARAALWLWALTGEQPYHQYFMENYTVTDAMTMDWWGPYLMSDEDALLFYTTLPGADAAVSADILSSKTGGTSDGSIYGFSPNDNLYRSSMPVWLFHWGSNQPRAAVGTNNLNVIEYGLDTANDADYRQRALETLHWFHGVNPHGKVMLSNMYDFGAESSVNEFYHSWFHDGSAWDSVLVDPFVGPAPGYVPGGPNTSYSGGLAPPTGEPPSKCYIDFNNDWPDNSWEVTENGIYYQAAYLRLAAYFVGE